MPTLQRMYQRRSKGYDVMGYTVAGTHEEPLVQARLGFADAGFLCCARFNVFQCVGDFSSRYSKIITGL